MALNKFVAVVALAAAAVAVPTSGALAGQGADSTIRPHAVRSSIPCKVVAQIPVKMHSGKVYALGRIRCSSKIYGAASVQLQEFKSGKWVNTLGDTQDGFVANPGKTVHFRGPVGFKHPGKVRTRLKIQVQAYHTTVTRNSSAVTFN